MITAAVATAAAAEAKEEAVGLSLRHEIARVEKRAGATSMKSDKSKVYRNRHILCLLIYENCAYPPLRHICKSFFP